MVDFLLEESQPDKDSALSERWSHIFEKLLEKENDLRKYKIDDDLLEYYGGSLFVEYLLQQGGIEKLFDWYKSSSSRMLMHAYGRRQSESDYRLLTTIDRGYSLNPLKAPHMAKADLARIKGKDLFTDGFIKYVKEQAVEFERRYLELSQQKHKNVLKNPTKS